MNSTIAPADDTRAADAEAGSEAPLPPPRQLVRLSVTIDEDEFDREIDQAFRKIGREARLPGFRAGKVPRKVLEARIGLAAAREEAMRDAVPSYLAKAVREHDVDLIATPEVELTGGADGGPVSFDAVCEVRPVVTVPGYGGLRVELPNPAASEADIDEAVDAERRRQGTLVDAGRPVLNGDHVTLTLSASRDGEPVAGLNTEDWLYEVGQGWVAEGFDDHLVGASAGDTLTFTATPSGTSDPADFDVQVTAVQEMELAELTDEWVSEHLGEYDTVAEWRAAIADRIGEGRLQQARSQFVDRTTSALAALVDAEPPASMVQADLQGRVQNMVQRLQSQGIGIEQWLSITGQTSEQFVNSLRGVSEQSVKVDLGLRAVATAEALEVDADDLEREYARVAVQVGQKASQVRKAYESNDAVSDLTAQIRKTKALDWLLERVEVVDEHGAALDRTLLLGTDHDHDHHDHDHEH